MPPKGSTMPKKAKGKKAAKPKTASSSEPTFDRDRTISASPQPEPKKYLNEDTSTPKFSSQPSEDSVARAMAAMKAKAPTLKIYQHHPPLNQAPFGAPFRPFPPPSTFHTPFSDFYQPIPAPNPNRAGPRSKMGKSQLFRTIVTPSY